MHPLSPLQNWLYRLGGLLLIAGAALPLFSKNYGVAFGLFAPGAVLFAWMQVLERYEGKSATIRRLRRIQLIGAACLVIAAALLFMRWKQIAPCRGGEWLIALCIAAVHEIYAAYRLPGELNKE